MEKLNKSTRKFGFKDKLAYAMGDFGCNMSFALNGTITTFYTMYVGLSTELMAILIILLTVLMNNRNIEADKSDSCFYNSKLGVKIFYLDPSSSI